MFQTTLKSRLPRFLLPVAILGLVVLYKQEIICLWNARWGQVRGSHRDELYAPPSRSRQAAAGPGRGTATRDEYHHVADSEPRQGLPAIYVASAVYNKSNPLVEPDDNMYVDITMDEGVDERISALQQVGGS